VRLSFVIRQQGTIRHSRVLAASDRSSRRAVPILDKRTSRPVASEEATQVSDFVPA
jgi:hypothetical protein